MNIISSTTKAPSSDQATEIKNLVEQLISLDYTAQVKNLSEFEKIELSNSLWVKLKLLTGARDFCSLCGQFWVPGMGQCDRIGTAEDCGLRPEVIDALQLTPTAEHKAKIDVIFARHIQARGFFQPKRFLEEYNDLGSMTLGDWLYLAGLNDAQKGWGWYQFEEYCVLEINNPDLEQWQSIAEELGFQPGWAYHKQKEYSSK